MCQQVKDHIRCVITNDSDRISKEIRRPFLKSWKVFHCENEEDEIMEMILKKSSVNDDKPLHLGIAILQYSKLLMLEFVCFLNEFLIKDSFSLVYTGTLKNISTALNYYFRYGFNRIGYDPYTSVFRCNEKIDDGINFFPNS